MSPAHVITALLCAVAPAEPAEPEPAGLRAPSSYLHVSPGVMTLVLGRPEYFGYLWGLSGGRFFPRRGRLLVSVGGFAEHLVITTPPAPPMNLSAYDGLFHFLRAGPELRVGASNERVFGYGLARLGVDLLLAQPGGFADVLGLVTLGGGVQGALGARRRLLLGVEPAVEVTFPIPWPLGRVRAFLGVRF